MAWSAVLMYAAKKVGEGALQRVGGALIDPFVKSIFGDGGESAYRNEVIARLTVIEAKLDQILKFLRDQLPDLLYEQSLRANMQSDSFLLLSAGANIEGAIRTFEKEKNKDNAEFLRSQAYDLAIATTKLARYGPTTSATVVWGFVAVLSAYARLIRYKEIYAYELISFAASILRICKPWLDPDLQGSIVRQINEKQAALDRAKPIFNALPATFLLCVSGPYFGDQSTTSIGMPAWFVGRTAEGWSGDFGNSRQRVLTNWQGDFAEFGFPIAQWWAPRKGAISKDEMHTLFGQAVALVNGATRDCFKLPAQIDELILGRFEVEKMIEACEKIMEMSNVAMEVWRQELLPN